MKKKTGKIIMPYTVTQRIKVIQQPAGGYIPVSAMCVKQYRDTFSLNDKENIPANYVGLAVDYLTRFRVTGNLEEAFDIPILGAKILFHYYGMCKEFMHCLELLESVKAGDISSAVQLTAYDDVYRAGIIDLPKLLPDGATIENIKIMVNRGVSFLKRFSEIKTGITFEGGYTDIVVNGDCDYLTDNSLIDFKVLRGNVTKNHTLQILIYYLMGLHSIHSSEFQKVKWLALFNPRKNIVYYIDVRRIPEAVINEVSRKVICYADRGNWYARNYRS